jgi:hypothetical protein
MKKNIGNFDRAFRVVFGLGVMSLAFVGPKTPWGFVGIIPLLTAYFSFCPLYKTIGVSTLHEQHKL